MPMHGEHYTGWKKRKPTSQDADIIVV